MTQTRKIIVQIATSADGYIARPDGSLDWLTRLPQFMRSVDAKLLGEGIPLVAPSPRNVPMKLRSA